MNKLLKDNMLFGFIIGLAIPIIAIIFYWQIKHGYMDMLKFFNYIINGNVYTQLMSLCILPNLAVFFIGMQFHKTRFCYGIIGATLFYTIVNFILKLV